MDGEWRSAAVMFIANLRKAGTTPESITARPQENRLTAPPPGAPAAAQQAGSPGTAPRDGSKVWSFYPPHRALSLFLVRPEKPKNAG
jgi:hypothetical protein